MELKSERLRQLDRRKSQGYSITNNLFMEQSGMFKMTNSKLRGSHDTNHACSQGSCQMFMFRVTLNFLFPVSDANDKDISI